MWKDREMGYVTMPVLSSGCSKIGLNEEPIAATSYCSPR